MAKEKAKPVEREYTVPLREKCRPVPRYKKTPKAVKSLKEFIAKHMQVRDRDLNKIRIDGFLNELIWSRGIKKPLHKVKVKAIKEGDIVRVYASDLTTKLKFKKERMEKQEVEAQAAAVKQKSLMEKAKETMQGKAPAKEDKGKDENKDGIEDKVEIKEKKASVEEAGNKEEDKKHKEAKHTTKTKETGEPKERVSEK